MVFNTTLNNIAVISWRTVLLVDQTRVGRDRTVAGFTSTCAISAYHHQGCEFESRSWRGIFDTTLCNIVC
jgi:hypothetical protein